MFKTYFVKDLPCQVLNPQPTPFCTVKPESGCIPVGGMINLELAFFAVDIEKFDFKIDVKVGLDHMIR